MTLQEFGFIGLIGDPNSPFKKLPMMIRDVGKLLFLSKSQYIFTFQLKSYFLVHTANQMFSYLGTLRTISVAGLQPNVKNVDQLDNFNSYNLLLAIFEIGFREN